MIQSADVFWGAEACFSFIQVNLKDSNPVRDEMFIALISQIRYSPSETINSGLDRLVSPLIPHSKKGRAIALPRLVGIFYITGYLSF